MAELVEKTDGDRLRRLVASGESIPDPLDSDSRFRGVMDGSWL